MINQIIFTRVQTYCFHVFMWCSPFNRVPNNSLRNSRLRTQPIAASASIFRNWKWSLINKFFYINPFFCFYANISVCDLKFFYVTTTLSKCCSHKFVYKSIIRKNNNCYLTKVILSLTENVAIHRPFLNVPGSLLHLPLA